MTIRGVLVGMVAAASAACAPIPEPGTNLAETVSGGGLAGQVEFDHGCARDRVRVIRRSPSQLSADLDVCGVVRRYEIFGWNSSSGGDFPVWLDVTALFPPGSLPAPLPPLPPPQAANGSAPVPAAPSIVGGPGVPFSP